MRWQEINNALECEFVFADFAQAFAFMTKVAALAEEMDHHPDWCNSWNKVTIRLCSHDKGNIVTDRDRRLAEAINNLL